jgi:hypothetical protein
MTDEQKSWRVAADEFRNDITDEVLSWVADVEGGYAAGDDAGACVLAMPQMVKVKEFILANLNIKDRAAARYDTVALAERHGLDPETVAWALS